MQATRKPISRLPVSLVENQKIVFRSGRATCLLRGEKISYVRNLTIQCPGASLCACQVVESHGFAPDALQFQFKTNALVFRAPEAIHSGQGYFKVCVTKPNRQPITFIVEPCPKKRTATPLYALDFKPLPSSPLAPNDPTPMLPQEPQPTPPAVAVAPVDTPPLEMSPTNPTTENAVVYPKTSFLKDILPASLLPSSVPLLSDSASVLQPISPVASQTVPKVTTWSKTSEATHVLNGARVRIQTVITTTTTVLE